MNNGKNMTSAPGAVRRAKQRKGANLTWLWSREGDAAEVESEAGQIPELKTGEAVKARKYSVRGEHRPVNAGLRGDVNDRGEDGWRGSSAYDLTACLVGP